MNNNNQDLFSLLSQVLANAGPGYSLNTLTGLMALVNLFGIINYLNSDKHQPPTPIASPSGSPLPPLNPEMLGMIMSMLGSSKGSSPTGVPTGGEEFPGLNPQMMFLLMNLLNSLNQPRDRNDQRDNEG